MAAPRKLWLDWQRGLAVVCMVEVHALDAWLAPGAGRGPLNDALRMLGGFAAPSFLFMAGLSQVLADARLERRGISSGERCRKALLRALWLLGAAYAFRLLEYVLGGRFRAADGWEDLLRVDVLNVIAVSLGLGALALAVPRRVHGALCAGAAAAIVLLTPPMAAWTHPPSRLLDYLFAIYPRANFSVFNWTAFALAGGAVGRLVADRERPPLLAIGAAVLAVGVGAERLPDFYAHQDFWRTSPAWFAMRLGGVIALAGVLQRVPVPADRGLAWLRTMGRHSLLGYVTSVELTYGALAGPLHRALSARGVLVGIAGMLAVTWALCAGADALAAWRRASAVGRAGAPSAGLSS